MAFNGMTSPSTPSTPVTVILGAFLSGACCTKKEPCRPRKRNVEITTASLIMHPLMLVVFLPSIEIGSRSWAGTIQVFISYQFANYTSFALIFFNKDSGFGEAKTLNCPSKFGCVEAILYGCPAPGYLMFTEAIPVPLATLEAWPTSSMGSQPPCATTNE